MTNQTVAQRLHDQLGRVIADTPPGHRLPSEPLLAEQLNVSRATLREAMRTYETQGVIRRKQGSGTYVNHPTQVLESGLEVLESIGSMAARYGLEVTFGALDVDRRPATPHEVALFSLQNTPNQEVVDITRVIFAEGHTVAYLIDTLPSHVLSPEDLNNGFTGSVLDLLLQNCKPALTTTRTEINAVPAQPPVARALEIQRGDVLLNFVADLYTEDGHIVDHSQSFFLPGFFRFHVIRRINHPPVA